MDFISRRLLADEVSDEDYKTTTSNHHHNASTDTRRILIRTILKRTRKQGARTGRRINIENDSGANALESRRSHPDKENQMTKVKIYRRKAALQDKSQGQLQEQETQEQQQQQIPMRVQQVEEREQKMKLKKRQKVLLKRKLEQSIQTQVELKTRPRTYTYFVTRKQGEGGSEEFVSSSTEVRDFTYSVTVSKTVYKTDSQVMTSLVPTFY